MAYESSYDTGMQPFNHDKHRGKWSSPDDFFFACLGHAFKIDVVFIMPVVLFTDMGIYMLIPYFITLGLCIIPIVFIQSFLGQFSSTGFLSVFRISPLCKGIGFVSLLINITTLTYFSILGAIPLFYFFYTLSPTIPWSCEGSKEWMDIPGNASSVCSITNITDYHQVVIPSVEFFTIKMKPMTMYHSTHPESRFSYVLTICSFVIWAMVAVVAIKPIETIGRFLRYSCLAVIGIMGLCLLRFMFLPGAHLVLSTIFIPQWHFLDSLLIVPAVALSSLGPGWGSILTMASYNKFDTNIFRYSWVLCVAQVGVIAGMAFLSLFITSFMLRDDPDRLYFNFIHSQWMEFLTIPTALTFLELPHFWSFLFFTMVVLGCLNLLIVQLISVMTSLFDEFEVLRGLKREIILATIGVLALTSVVFCSNYGITSFETHAQISLISQMILNLLLLIVVVWIYGRERFQRDVNFMTNRTYSTWMVNIVRYVTPIFLFLAWIIAVAYMSIRLEKLDLALVYLIFFISLLAWCCIPGYCIFKMFRTSGVLGTRVRRLARPNDWYPMEPMDRRKYEERFCATEISHNLTTGSGE